MRKTYRLRRLMRENGLFHQFHSKYTQTTDSEHDLLKAPAQSVATAF